MAGTAKAFNLTPEQVLYEMSYANIILYTSTLPSYEAKKNGDEKKSEKKIKADDPRNKAIIDNFLNTID